jgi:hypothetical protein
LFHEGGAIIEESGSMRSLWRILALQWLGGEGSEALTEDSGSLEMFAGEPMASHAFDVRRAPGASVQQPATAPNARGRSDPEDAIGEERRNGSRE